MTKKVFINCIIQIILIPFLGCENIFSQQEPGSEFSQLYFSAQYNRNISDGNLNEYWSPDKSGALQISSPFYKGIIGVGLDFQSFTSNEIRQPDFKTYYIYLSWTQKLHLFLGTTISTGIKVGSFIMLFDDGDLSEYQSNESELGLAAIVKYEISITKRVSIYAQGDFQTVFTHKRIKLFNAGGGISYMFDTPGWLREFLK